MKASWASHGKNRASLWSDKALLYRQELSLSAEDSGMAVVIQQLVCGQVSGICFTREPVEETLMAISALSRWIKPVRYEIVFPTTDAI